MVLETDVSYRLPDCKRLSQYYLEFSFVRNDHKIVVQYFIEILCIWSRFLKRMRETLSKFHKVVHCSGIKNTKKHISTECGPRP